MTDRDSSSAYRDDLAAAQARIAALEEELATREDGEGDDDPGVDDPETAQLIQQREDLARIVAAGEPGADIKKGAAVLALFGGWIVCLAMLCIDASPLGFAIVSWDPLSLGSAVVGGTGVVAVALYFAQLPRARKATAIQLQKLDARIVQVQREQDERRDEARRKRDEARRLRTIERELVALREAREKAAASEVGAPRVRVEVDDELEEEARDELLRARRR